jgi:hypothetical protein
MHIVGIKAGGLDSAPVSPEAAWRRGRVLDGMLPASNVTTRGATRLSHAQRNALDDARMLEIAKILNDSRFKHGAA